MGIHAKILTEHLLQLFVKVKMLIAETVAGQQYQREKKIYPVIDEKYIYYSVWNIYIYTLKIYIFFIRTAYSLPIWFLNEPQINLIHILTKKV